MKIWKLHALGNNFVFTLHDDRVSFPDLAMRLCQRETSIGADGLLSIDFASQRPMVRMWNPDGTPDFCGNGLCCAAHLIRYLGQGDIRELATPVATVPARVVRINGAASQVAIRIAKGTFDPQLIPLSLEHATLAEAGMDIRVEDRTFRVISVNNGNMHSLIFGDKLPEDDFFYRFGPKIETHPVFPNRSNVLWCSKRGDALHLRIWERGVGETLSCGTGAAAAVVVSQRAGHELPRSVSVEMRGGTAKVELLEDEVEIRTLAELVFEGILIQSIQ